MKISNIVLVVIFCIGAATVVNGGVINVNLTNTDGPRQILNGESTGVIDTAGWVNLSTASSDNIDGTVVDVATAGSIGLGNTARDAGNPDGTDAFLALFEAGLRDSTPATLDDTYFTISDMTAYLASEGDSSYNIYAYYKSPISEAADEIALGLATDAFTTVDPDATKISANDSFVESGTAESNYILFSGQTADSSTVYINRVDRDGLLTGFQIETIPEPSSVSLLGLIGLICLVKRKLVR